MGAPLGFARKSLRHFSPVGEKEKKGGLCPFMKLALGTEPGIYVWPLGFF